MQREKIVSVSGLKGFSCVIIMLYHYRFILMNNGIELINYGHYFVEVFVTISGFLMAYNYRDRIPNLKFTVFFIKRYLKIMPLYWITEICVYIALIMATLLSKGEISQWEPKQILLELSGFYTGWFGQAEPPVNSPLWTVCCLLLCYVLYYIICRAFTSRRVVYRSAVLFLIISFVFLLNQLVDKDEYYSILGSEDSIRCIISFLVGVLLYELYEIINKKQGIVISLILLIAFAVIVIAFLQFKKNGVSSIENATSWIVIFIFCPLTLYSSIYLNPINYAFSRGAFQFIGALSTDIYMWHWVVRIYLGSRPFNLDQETWSGWLLLIIATFLVSVLSHYIIMPFIYRIGVMIKKIDNNERIIAS